MSLKAAILGGTSHIARAITPYLLKAVGSTYPAKNQIKTTVADQLEEENSLYNYYCKLIAIRHKYPALARGDYNAVTTSEKNVGGFVIEYNNEKLILFHNTSTKSISIDLSKCKDLDGYSFSKICDSIGVGNAKLEGTILTIEGQTSVLVK